MTQALAWSGLGRSKPPHSENAPRAGGAEMFVWLFGRRRPTRRCSGLGSHPRPAAPRYMMPSRRCCGWRILAAMSVSAPPTSHASTCRATRSTRLSGWRMRSGS